MTRFTSFHFWGLVIGLIALYWIPALIFPDETKNSVNIAYFLLSLITAFTLLGDMIDLAITRGRDISWQAALAKVGLFLMVMSFCFGRAWAYMVARQEYPDALLRSPIGGFPTFILGVGIGFVWYGMSSVDSRYPAISFRGTGLILVACGIVIGLAVSKMPF